MDPDAAFKLYGACPPDPGGDFESAASLAGKLLDRRSERIRAQAAPVAHGTEIGEEDSP